MGIGQIDGEFAGAGRGGGQGGGGRDGGLLERGQRIEGGERVELEELHLVPRRQPAHGVAPREGLVRRGEHRDATCRRPIRPRLEEAVHARGGQ